MAAYVKWDDPRRVAHRRGSPKKRNDGRQHFCWTPELEERLKDLVSSGRSRGEITLEMKITIDQCIYRMHALGLKIGRGGHYRGKDLHWTAADDARLRELDTLPAEFAAEALDRSVRAIYERRARIGLARRTRSRMKPKGFTEITRKAVAAHVPSPEQPKRPRYERVDRMTAFIERIANLRRHQERAD